MNWNTFQKIPWKPTKRNYIIAREVSLIWGQIDATTDLVAAVLFGMEKWDWAIALWVIGMISSYINSKVYLWVLEQMAKDKVRHGRKKKNGL